MSKDYLQLFQSIYRFFADGDRLTYAALGVALLTAFFYFRIFFRNASGFQDDIEKSDKIPLVDRDYDYVESKWSEHKIMIWIMISIGCGVGAYYQLPVWFPHMFKAP